MVLGVEISQTTRKRWVFQEYVCRGASGIMAGVGVQGLEGSWEGW